MARRILTITLIVLVLCALSTIGYSQEYIFSSGTPTMLHKQPSQQSDILLEINQGEKLVVIEKQNEWVRVFYEEKIGYIESKHLSSNPLQEDAILIDFADIYNQYKKNKEEMTKIKFASWWEEMQEKLGKELIQAQGYVEQAKETWGGDLIIQLDTVPSSETGNATIKLQMDPEKDKEKVAELDIDDFIKYTGRVSKINVVLGLLFVEMNEVSIVSREKYVPPKKETLGEQTPQPQRSPQTIEKPIANSPGKQIPTPAPKTKPTAIPTTIPASTSTIDIHTAVVMAESLITDYITTTHGFNRKYIKFGRRLAQDKITALGNNRYQYENSLSYKNAFNADMERNVQAIIRQEQDGKTWTLQGVEFN